MLHEYNTKVYAKIRLLLTLLIPLFAVFVYLVVFRIRWDIYSRLLSFKPKTVYLSVPKPVEPAQHGVLKRVKFVDIRHRQRVEQIRAFFRRYNSPLAEYAEDFVSAAEKYGIDYRLMPAISIVESGGGKHLFKPHNPFGWGNKGYPSFKAAIYDVARGLSVYYRTGRTTPATISKTYNPVTPKSWASKVSYLMGTMKYIR